MLLQAIFLATEAFWSHAGFTLWPFSSSSQQCCLYFSLALLWIWLPLTVWPGGCFASCFVQHGQSKQLLHRRSLLLLKSHQEQGEDGNRTFSLVQRGTAVPS